MRTHLKLAALLVTSSLVLASCGGGTTTTPTPNGGTDPAPAGDTSPVPGGTIAKPADATAAGEFVITGEKATVLAQALRVGPYSRDGMTAQDMHAQANSAELHVLVAVTRTTSGTNAGKKKAVATFVWGNQTEQITGNGADQTLNPAVVLDVYPQATPAAVQTTKGSLSLKVEAPDFQDKTTKSSPYIADSGLTCARLVVDLKSLPNSADPKKATPDGYTPYLFNTSAAPLEVCEGQTEKDAEATALTKYTTGLNYTYQSAAAAPWAFEHFDSETATPSNARLLELENLPAGTAVTNQTLTEFFAPLEVLPAGDSKTWTTEQKAAAAVARKYISLRKQLSAYYQNINVYRAAVTNGRENIYIFGKNGFGVGGVKTVRFIP